MGILVVASHLNRFDIVALLLCGLLLGMLRSSINRNKRQSQISLAPGPKGLPILGNTLDMPWRDEHLTLTRWGKQYGAFAGNMTVHFSVTGFR